MRKQNSNKGKGVTMKHVSPAEIIEKDTSSLYLTLLRVRAEDEYNGEFVQHMLDAAVMSHYKYGWVADKPSTHYKTLAVFEYKGFEKDHNLEHMVNIANYSMFRFMLSGKQGAESENTQELVDIGVEAMKRYNHPEAGEFYQGADSDKSVAKKTPKPVRDHLRSMLLDSAYDFIEPKQPTHFSVVS